MMGLGIVIAPVFGAHSPDFSTPTASGAIWPVWSGSNTNVAVATGSRPTSAALFPACPQGQAPVASGAPLPGIEYEHHRVLDVVFDEDNIRIRTGYAVHNMVIPRPSPTTCCR